jgi:protocatechuate 3,4-dioxygenase beta subunit
MNGSSDSRRKFLHLGTALGAGLLLPACGSSTETNKGQGPAGPGSGGSGPGPGPGPGGGGVGGGAGGMGGRGPTPQCEESDVNIEGPFYTPSAPDKTSLYEPGMPGVRVVIAGKVLGLDGCSPLESAILDVWQANDAGAYDNVGFTLRGVFQVDPEGNYSIDTIIPGHYLNGSQYRPAHVHFKVSAPGYVLLTTQLYFEGDPYNDIDPFIEPSLIMAVNDGPNGGKACTFDFVLRPTG